MLVDRPQYLKWLWDLKDHNLIKVLTGVRRVGKSTLLQMHADRLMESGVHKDRVLILNFEDPDVYTIGDWKAIYDHVKTQLDPDHMNYVFLDEVQQIPMFERFVDGLFIKKNVDLYVTGSNSYFLSGELATLLTGRSIEKHVLPLDFKEYLDAIKYARNDLNSPDLGTLGHFIHYGGMPEAVSLLSNSSESSRSFLAGVLKTIVTKDIYPRQRYYNDAEFEDTMKFVFDSIGSIVSPNSIANTLRSEKMNIIPRTIRHYLRDLCDSYLFYKVQRYDLKGKRLLRTQEKYYTVDTGFRWVALGRNLGTDLGHLLENAVYIELLRRFPFVSIGKNNSSEVDFVTRDYSGNINYYQVAYNALGEETLKRELSAFNGIKDSYPKYLISMDALPDLNYNGIKHLNAKDWFLGEDV